MKKILWFLGTVVLAAALFVISPGVGSILFSANESGDRIVVLALENGEVATLDTTVEIETKTAAQIQEAYEENGKLVAIKIYQEDKFGDKVYVTGWYDDDQYGQSLQALRAVKPGDASW